MQFKVPQDVQQADRIIGPLTFIQLIISIVGIGFAYATFAILSKQGLPAPLWAIPVGIILILTASFAFLKINNLPFHKLLALLIERFIIPSKRIWVKGADRITETEITKKTETKDNESQQAEQQKQAQFEKIADISSVLDKKNNSNANQILEKIDKTADSKLIKTAFGTKNNQPKEKTPNTQLSTTPKPNAPAKNIKKSAQKTQQAPSKEEKDKKILKLSKNPPSDTSKPQPDLTTSPSKQTSIITPSPIPTKKKRRRRRRKKKNKTLSTQLPTTATPKPKTTPQTTAAKATKPEDTNIMKKKEEPIPNWLQEGVKETAPAQTEKKENTQSSQVNSPPPTPQTQTSKPNSKTPETSSTNPPPLADWLQEGLTEKHSETKTPPENDHPAPTNQPPPNTAKPSAEFTAEDLKKGQEITFE